MAPISKKRKREIWQRDNFICHYCGLDLTMDYQDHVFRASNVSFITVDHVKPKWQGGTNEPSNLVTSCLDCNHEKGLKEAPIVVMNHWKRKRMVNKESKAKSPKYLTEKQQRMLIYGGAPLKQ